MIRLSGVYTYYNDVMKGRIERTEKRGKGVEQGDKGGGRRGGGGEGR